MSWAFANDEIGSYINSGQVDCHFMGQNSVAQFWTLDGYSLLNTNIYGHHLQDIMSILSD